MAVAFIQEFPIITNDTTNYDAIDAELDVELAASTSSAVHCAGADNAWVSLPMKSGPSVPWMRR